MRRSKKPAAARRHAQLSRQVARNDMALGLTSLFRPLPDGAVRREIVAEQEFAGVKLRFRGVEMSIFEQGVFFAVLAVALRGGEFSSAAQAGLLPDLPHKDVRATDHAANIAAQRDSLEVRTSLAELCCMAGLQRKPGGETIEAIKTAFERLHGVTVFAQAGDHQWGITHLLGGGLGHGGEVAVRLNPRATRALLAAGSGSYAQIEMPVYRALRGTVPRALYAWLAAWFCGRSGAREISIERIEVHVFGAVASAKASRSRRRKQIAQALAAIGEASGGEYTGAVAGGMARITRQWVSGEGLRPARNQITPSAEPVCLGKPALYKAAAQAAAEAAAAA